MTAGAAPDHVDARLFQAISSLGAVEAVVGVAEAGRRGGLDCLRRLDLQSSTSIDAGRAQQRSGHAGDVCLTQIVALEEQRLTGRFGLPAPAAP